MLKMMYNLPKTVMVSLDVVKLVQIWKKSQLINLSLFNKKLTLACQEVFLLTSKCELFIEKGKSTISLDCDFIHHLLISKSLSLNCNWSGFNIASGVGRSLLAVVVFLI